MIQQSDIMPTLLAACPDFRSVWEEHLRYWGEEGTNIYNDTAAFVSYLVDRYEHGDRTCLPLVFETIESFLTQGTPDTRGVAEIGILEGIQNVALNHGIRLKAFVKYLQPKSKVAWDELIDLWEGKSSLAQRGNTHLTGISKSDSVFCRIKLWLSHFRRL